MEWRDGQEIVSVGGHRQTYRYAGTPQAEWESCGWRAAESPAAPVERALAAGWVTVAPEECACKWEETCRGPAIYLNAGLGYKYPYCESHAEYNRAFATPAPTVTITARENLLNGTWGAPVESPTPKPAPRCEYRTAAHEGTPVERVMLVNGVAKRLLACDACYLERERVFAVNTHRERGARQPPRATVGVVPVVFGLSVGILSRGMAIAAPGRPPRPPCPVHGYSRCDGGTGCTWRQR